MRLIADERKTGTIELLMTSPITDRDLVLGKYLASIGLIAVLLALTLTFPITVAWLGPLDKGATFAAYVLIWARSLEEAGAHVVHGLPDFTERNREL